MTGDIFYTLDLTWNFGYTKPPVFSSGLLFTQLSHTIISPSVKYHSALKLKVWNSSKCPFVAIRPTVTLPLTL